MLLCLVPQNYDIILESRRYKLLLEYTLLLVFQYGLFWLSEHPDITVSPTSQVMQ